MRIRRALWVTSSFPLREGDSTAPFLLQMAKGLKAEGWEITVLAPAAPNVPDHAVIDGIEVRRFRYMWPTRLQTLFYKGGALGSLARNPAKALLLPFFAISMFLAVRKACRRARQEDASFALVHSHWLIPNGLLAGLAARWQGVPHLISCHGSDLTGLQAAPLLALKRAAMRRAGAVHVNSPAMRAIADALLDDGSTSDLIPLGLDLHEVERLKGRGRAEGATLLFVGRLSPEKGCDRFLEIVAAMVQRQEQLTARIIGAGPDRERLEKKAQLLGVDGRVTFMGAVAPGVALENIRAASVLVVPSRSEGLGMVALEALALETPVVASAVGGLPYALGEGRAGWLVPPEDNEGFIQALQAALKDETERLQRVREGARYVKRNFEQRAVSMEMAKLYEQVAVSPADAGNVPAS